MNAAHVARNVAYLWLQKMTPTEIEQNTSRMPDPRSNSLRQGLGKGSVPPTSLLLCLITSCCPSVLLLPTATQAFALRTTTRNAQSLPYVHSPHTISSLSSTRYLFEEKVEDDEDEGDEKKEWLSWMSTGIRVKKYNYDEVKLREDERLGGLPRSVGYSSRDWFHNTLTLPTSGVSFLRRYLKKNVL